MLSRRPQATPQPLSNVQWKLLGMGRSGRSLKLSFDIHVVPKLKICTSFPPYAFTASERMCICVGCDSSVRVTSRYGLEGSGIESRCRRDFPHLSKPALGPTQPRVERVSFFFPGVKRPGSVVDHPPSSSAKVKERVELHLYLPSGPSWPVIG
jgi:hypothetical protein